MHHNSGTHLPSSVLILHYMERYNRFSFRFHGLCCLHKADRRLYGLKQIHSCLRDCRDLSPYGFISASYMLYCSFIVYMKALRFSYNSDLFALHFLFSFSFYLYEKKPGFTGFPAHYCSLTMPVYMQCSRMTYDIGSVSLHASAAIDSFPVFISECGQ